MANKPSHGTQQRILAFVATKPHQEIIRAGTVQTCTAWIAKRLGVAEKTIVSELEVMERDGLVKLARNTAGNRAIHTVQVVHGVEPADWALAEFADDDLPAVEAPAIPTNIDYRKLADSVLLAALDVMGSGDTHQHDQKVKDDEIANLTEANEQMRAELSHVKVERDTNIRARKVAEQAAHDEKNKADQARSDLAERESDIEELINQVRTLKRAVRDAAMGADLLEGLPSEGRESAALALARILNEGR